MKNLFFALSLFVVVTHLYGDAPTIVMRLDAGQDYESVCRSALIETIATHPNIEIRETWLPMIRDGKMIVTFPPKQLAGNLGRFFVTEESGKMRAGLEIVGPFIASPEVSRKRQWATLLHEFMHYKDWAENVYPKEYFLDYRMTTAETFRKETRAHFEGEIRANKIMYAFLEEQNYDGMEGVNHPDHEYRLWKKGGAAYIVEFVYDNMMRQGQKNPLFMRDLPTRYYISELRDEFLERVTNEKWRHYRLS